MRIVLISDTHTLHRQIDVPEGDLVIFAGDCSSSGKEIEVKDFMKWFSGLPHKHKVCIAGNHDFWFDQQHKENPNHTPHDARDIIPDNVVYLEDESIEIEGYKIWGSPVTPWFYDWAFNMHEDGLKTHWRQIPEDTDIIITHGPAYGHGDKTDSGVNAGCPYLLKRIEEVRPLLHVFGHIHEGYGITELLLENNKVIMANASCLDLGYRAVNPPLIIEL